MKRLAKYTLFFAATATACLIATYYYFKINSSHSVLNTVKNVSDFDFAGFDFGIVAVAISFAGVYLSIVPDRCAGQMLQAVEDHFISDPFSVREDMARTCHPNNCPPGVDRTDGIKAIHSLINLKRWVALSKKQKEEFVGVNGLDPQEGWLGEAFLFFQERRDKLIIVSFAIVTSIFYIFLPLSYLMETEKSPSALLGIIYVLCIVEMIFCMAFYAYREFFMIQFEKKFEGWRQQIRNFMFADLARQVSAAAAAPTPAPASVGPSILVGPSQQP